MKGEKEKICDIKDTEKLRSVVTKGGKISCAICCAASDDSEELCSPVYTKGANLFCDPRTEKRD